MPSHLHTTIESAYDAVRRSISAREAERRAAAEKERRADERSPWTSNLLLEGDGAVEAPRDRNLHDAYRAIMSGDREAFSRAVRRAIDARIADAIADLKLEFAMNMTAGIEDAEEEDD